MDLPNAILVEIVTADQHASRIIKQETFATQVVSLFTGKVEISLGLIPRRVEIGGEFAIGTKHRHRRWFDFKNVAETIADTNRGEIGYILVIKVFVALNVFILQPQYPRVILKECLVFRFVRFDDT